MMQTIQPATELPAAQAESDEALMLRFGRGELAAFDELYRRNEARVWRFIRRSVASAALADELMQETWLGMIAQASRYQPQSQFRTWLFTIARHRVIDAHRRDRAGDGAAVAREVVDGAPGPELAAQQGEEARRLLAAMARLPAEQLEALLLQVEAGLGIAEIASTTDVPVETAKSRLRYARAALRAVLGEQS
jgi:RNA polymerase sigma factor (sigma-70 family)